MIKSALFILTINCVYYASSDIIVQASEGLIKGTTAKSRSGRTFFRFTGIPYAEPPVGQLRFRSPVPKKPWNGTFEALRKGNICVQHGKNNNILGHEDCLTLNVYTPKLHKGGEALLPVIVYIHGGGYIAGASNIDYLNPGYLLDKNIVLVLMNYRLGILGFFSTGDLAAPGNFGLKDQVLALKWVQRNIRAFGGNPKKVTIMGQSAGASCVSLHAISDMSAGLFHQYIIMSGIFFSPWAFRSDPSYYANAKAVAAQFNCISNNSFILVDCLRNITFAELQNSKVHVDELLHLLNVPWAPTSEPQAEDAFLTDSPANLVKEGKLKDFPFLTGNVKDEGLFATTVLYTNDTEFEMYKTQPVKVIEALLQFYGPINVKNVTELSVKLKNYYLGEEMPEDDDIIRKRFTDLTTDYYFFYPQVRFMRQAVHRNINPFYFYEFAYTGTLSHTMSITKNNKTIGVAHADDLIYLFPVNGSYFGLSDSLQLDKTDYKVVDRMVDLWVSFAYYGIPASLRLHCHPFRWKPYKRNTSTLQIGNYTDPKAFLKHSFYEERMRFWYENAPDIIGA